MVAEVRLAASADGNDRAVVEIVVPETVQSVSAVLHRAHQPDMLWLVLGDEDNSRSGAAARARRAISAMMCSADSSCMACVASIRRPSSRYSSIQ